jgi:MerR family transcriptional regulator, light-induced transcriptional regulator
VTSPNTLGHAGVANAPGSPNAAGSPNASGAAPHGPDADALCTSYLQAQLGGNRREALRLIVEDGLAQGLSCQEAHRVIRQAQQEIGRLWQEDRISIAQEHMATAISQVVLSHIYQHANAPSSNGKKVVVACVEGELHDFPARLVADSLDLAGFELRYLGASVPTDGLLRMVGEERPALLVLSVTMTFNVPKLREAVRRVREQHPDLPIAIGGGACVWNQGLAAELDATISGRDATELVENARKLLGVAA